MKEVLKGEGWKQAFEMNYSLADSFTARLFLDQVDSTCWRALQRSELEGRGNRTRGDLGVHSSDQVEFKSLPSRCTTP